MIQLYFAFSHHTIRVSRVQAVCGLSSLFPTGIFHTEHAVSCAGSTNFEIRFFFFSRRRALVKTQRTTLRMFGVIKLHIHFLVN